MIVKILLTFGVLIYGLGVPYLEINATHVFNPDWTPHVRIHEVWQLLTNSALGLYSLWLIWQKNNLHTPALLGILITGGFLLAYALQDGYGGSMKYLGGSEKLVFGLNIGVVGFGLVSLIFIFVLFKKATHSDLTT